MHLRAKQLIRLKNKISLKELGKLWLYPWLAVINTSFPETAFAEEGPGAVHEDAKNTETSRDRNIINPPSFVIDSINIPIIKNARLLAYIKISLIIDAKTVENYDVASKKTPILIDAIFIDLYDILSRMWTGESPSIDSLRKRIQKVCDEAFPKTPVTVYIKNIYVDQRPSIQTDLKK